MEIHKAYKVELDPNNKQATLLKKHWDAHRFSYNWGLEQKQNAIRINQFLPIPRINVPTAFDLRKRLNSLKKTKYPWLYETSKCAPQEALRDLDNAFKNFYAKRAKHPRFKSKRNCGSFAITGDRVRILSGHIQLSRIGKIKLKERNYVPTNLHILSATVSSRAGRWFVSVNTIQTIEPSTNNGPVVGVDIGIRNLATTSDGKFYENPRALRRNTRKLKRLQRSLSRKQKGSKNRTKARKRLSNLHYRISCIRSDALHKLTTELARTKSVIVVEDLNVKGMVKNHHIAGAILDIAPGEFYRQLVYKTQWYGSKLVLADKFYPSSKMCSTCGHIKKDLKRSDTIYHCVACGLVIDRDLNAALNLRKLAVSSTDSSAEKSARRSKSKTTCDGLNACLSQEVSEPAMVPCLAVIQESNTRSG